MTECSKLPLSVRLRLLAEIIYPFPADTSTSARFDHQNQHEYRARFTAVFRWWKTNYASCKIKLVRAKISCIENTCPSVLASCCRISESPIPQVSSEASGRLPTHECSYSAGRHRISYHTYSTNAAVCDYPSVSL